MPQNPARVVVVSPMPPEKAAYALARYSRSPDSIRQSLDWVRTHDEKAFLESYYFQYGHASIADLGHATFCFEGVSELAAIEIEDEPLWDGQARSSRYQDFSKAGVIAPPELSSIPACLAAYQSATETLLSAYHQLHTKTLDYLLDRHPRPESMKPEPYRRALAARAYDVARYVLFLGIPTGVGQVSSLRTLEKQVRRLGASPYAEVRDIAAEMAQACAAPPGCLWDAAAPQEPLAPTLARHADPDPFPQKSRASLAAWAAQNFPTTVTPSPASVDLVMPADPLDEIVATLLYPVTHQPFRCLYDHITGWSLGRKREVVDVAVEGRARRDELLREFRSGYAFLFDVVVDIGAFRDLHRHRRCQQICQPYTEALGHETPALLIEAGLEDFYHQALDRASAARRRIGEASPEAAHYLLPFATRMRCLFKMDFAEAEYISRLRSGVKGHFAYRDIAWKMREKMMAAAPELGRLIDATPPWIEDALTR